MRKRIGHQEEFRGPENLTAKNLTGNPLMESDGRWFSKRLPEQLQQSYGSNRSQITLCTGRSTLPRLYQSIGDFVVSGELEFRLSGAVGEVSGNAEA